MNKTIVRIAAMLMAASMLVIACSKPNKSGGNKDNQEQGDKTDGAQPIDIALDGTFADWDAITEAVADKNPYVDMIKGGDDDPIQVFKVAAGADNIYFYIEFLADHLPQNESSGTWGSSNSENALIVGEDDDDYREVMHLFIDPDGNPGTGFLSFADPEGDDETPAISNLGCEMCAQFFMYFKPSTGLVSVAFEQTLVGPTKLGNPGENDQVDDAGYTGDYDYNGTICQSWPDEGPQAAFPLWGWQNPDDSGKGDNDCPRPENWKPGKVESSGIAKVEFCLEIRDIVNRNDDDDEFACGIIFDWDKGEEPYYQATSALRVSYVK